MKSLKSQSYDIILNKIYESNTLTERLKEYVEMSEMDYVDDILRCFKGCNYEFGLYNHNWIKVYNYNDFLDGILTAIYNFGFTEKIEKLVHKAEKLKDSNLFAYTIHQVIAAIVEYLNDILKYVEDILYKIYNKEISEDLFNYFQFIDDIIDGIYIDDNGNLLCIQKLN